jgi:hypothetical protein
VAICALCPVRLACLDWAIEHNERNGIWGGVSARSRQRMRAGARRRIPVLSPVNAASTNRVPSFPRTGARPATHQSVEAVEMMSTTARRSKDV